MIGLYHVGIGFNNSKTSHKSHAEFFAPAFGLGLLNPVVDQPNVGQWNWSGRAATTYFYEVWDNADGWISHTQVATIKGSDYNKIVSWICSGDLKKKLWQYVLFSLATPDEALPYQKQQHVSGEVVPAKAAPGSRPPGSSTCMDAGALILQKIEEVAGSGAFLKTDVDRDDVARDLVPWLVA